MIICNYVTHTGTEFVNISILSDHAFMTTGAATILACAGYGLPNVEISWMHNGQAVFDSPLVSISEEKLIQKEYLMCQSFLQICDLEAANAGAYTCIISNGEISVNSSTELTLTGMILLYYQLLHPTNNIVFPKDTIHIFLDSMSLQGYSGTSDKGLSEIGTTSHQFWTPFP